jgi:hypothetical protein
MMTKPAKRSAARSIPGSRPSTGSTRSSTPSTPSTRRRRTYVRSQAHDGWTLIRTRYNEGGYSGGSTRRSGRTRTPTRTAGPLLRLGD